MTERTCSVEGCERAHAAREFCRSHYRRWKSTGDPGPASFGYPGSRLTPKRACRVKGCNRRVAEDGLCRTHTGKPQRRAPGRATCSVEGCGAPHHGNGFCGRHNARYKRYGDPLGESRYAGPEHHKWTADEATYDAAHGRVKSHRGRARQYPCAHCEGGAAEWAFDHCDPAPRIAPWGAPYSLDVEHYIPLCVPCHRRFDRDHAAAS